MKAYGNGVRASSGHLVQEDLLPGRGEAYAQSIRFGLLPPVTTYHREREIMGTGTTREHGE